MSLQVYTNTAEEWTLVTLVRAWKLELETKVHTNIRNHGEGPY